MTATASDTDEFVRTWQAWHDEVDAARSHPHGMLAYTSFNLLSTTPQRFADLPGSWTTGPQGHRSSSGPTSTSSSTASPCAAATPGA